MKRSFSILLALSLIGGVFSALPAGAQESAPRAVPAAPNIVDDASDANGLTPQGGPAGGVNFSGADILAGWFTADAQSLYTHLQITAATRGNFPLFYRVRVDPGAGTNCLWLTASFPSALDPSAPTATLRDTCDGDVRTPGEVVLEAGPEETGVVTMKFPRAEHPALADGSVLKAPWAETTLFAGTNTANPQTGTPIGGATAPVLDMTDPGADYVVGSGGGPKLEPAPEEPPGKNDPPGKGKKKGCKKGKGKKKGACPGKKSKKPKPPGAPACPAYVPGEEGAEVETTIVTDAATEEAPVVVELTAGAGLANDLGLAGGAYDETSSVFQNVQVDTASSDAGLYAKLEFQNFHDYDLYLNHPDGSTAANSGDFNVAPGEGLGGGSPDGAWEAGTNYESVMGIRTADCGGYTARMVSYLTNGGAITLSLWLGEVTGEPAAPGGGEQSAFDAFWGRLGL